MQSIDQVSKRLAALEAKVSTTIVGKIVANEGNRRATIHLGDAAHPLLHVLCVSSYFPRVGQSVRVQRSGNKLLILGSTNFDQSTVISNVAPAPPYPGQLWYDTNESVLKSWDGSAWVKLGAVDSAARDAAATSQTAADLAKMIADQASTSANGKNHNYYGTVMPTMPPGVFVDGDMWFDQSLTTDGYVKNTPYIWRVVAGVGSWVTTRDDLLRTNLNTALGAANGKNRNFYQIAAPTVAGVAPYILQVGDTWFDSDGGYAISRWDGTTWVAAPLGTTAIADGAITTQQITASGIDAGRITSGIIDAAVITVKNIDASKITVGGMDASRITVGTLGSQVIYSGSVYANKIVAASGGIGGAVALEVSTVTASGPAFRVNYGSSYFANDVTVNGNIYLSNTSGSFIQASGTHVVHISQSQLQIDSPGTYITSQPSGSITPLYFYTTNGTVCRSSSSAKYKDAIADIANMELDPKKLLDLPVRQFTYKTEDTGQLYPGLIAEEVAEIYPIAAYRDEEGAPSDWNMKHIIPGMLALIQQQAKRITALEEALDAR